MDYLHTSHYDKKSEEKVLIIKPKVMIRKSRLVIASRKQNSIDISKNNPQFFIVPQHLARENSKSMNVDYNKIETVNQKNKQNLNTLSLF